MKNRFKLFGTQSLRFCAITLTALFAFTLIACENSTTSSGKSALTGTVSITGGSGGNGAVMVGDSLGVDTDLLKGSGTISYRWQNSDAENGNYTNISGETSAAFEVDSQWADKWIKVVVSRADNSGSVTSAAVQVIAGTNDLKGTVTLPQKIQVGKYISPEIELENEGLNSWECTLQWQQCATEKGVYVNINDETYPTYEVNVEPGTYIRVVVTYPDYTGNIKSNACLVEAAGKKVVTSVTVTGSESISKGGFKYYSVQVKGDNLDEWSDDQKVTWELTGATKSGTYIDEWGWLRVAANETVVTLTVKATSVLTPTISGTFEVTVAEAEGLIIAIQTITGISGEVTVAVLDTLDPNYDYNTYEGEVASGVGTIDNGTVTVALAKNNWGVLTPWNDKGEFYIKITKNFGEFQDTYVYTAGKTLNTGNWDDNATYEFKADEKVTINFNQFAPLPLGEGGNKFTITSLSSSNGAVAYLEVLEKSMFGGTSPAATGHAVITGSSVTITLADKWDTLTGWKEEGTYYLKLTIYQGKTKSVYVYTKGDTLETLEIVYWNDYWENAPQFEIKASLSSIAFNQFVSGDNIELSFGW